MTIKHEPKNKKVNPHRHNRVKLEVISEEKEEHCGVVLCGKLQPPTFRCGIQSFKGSTPLAWPLKGTEVFVWMWRLADKYCDFDIQNCCRREEAGD